MYFGVCIICDRSTKYSTCNSRENELCINIILLYHCVVNSRTFRQYIYSIANCNRNCCSDEGFFSSQTSIVGHVLRTTTGVCVDRPRWSMYSSSSARSRFGCKKTSAKTGVQVVSRLHTFRIRGRSMRWQFGTMIRKVCVYTCLLPIWLANERGLRFRFLTFSRRLRIMNGFYFYLIYTLIVFQLNRSKITIKTVEMRTLGQTITVAIYVYADSM